VKKLELKRIEAILFDLEGTLVDFQWNLKGALIQNFGELIAYLKEEWT